jgi:hypothetical protein
MHHLLGYHDLGDEIWARAPHLRSELHPEEAETARGSEELTWECLLTVPTVGVRLQLTIYERTHLVPELVVFGPEEV